MNRPDDIFNFNEWQKHLEEVLDNQFPKGGCKQRGHALVLYAEFQIFISCLVKDLNESLQKIKRTQHDVLGRKQE